MDVAVQARRSQVTDEVKELALTKVSRLVKRVQVIEKVEVKLDQDPHAPVTSQRVCEVTATGHGHVMRATASADDFLAAVDMALKKLEHQVERLKGKLVDRSHPRKAKGPSRS